MSLAIAFVTETFPPEVNGVAMTVGRLVGGLRSVAIGSASSVPDRARPMPAASMSWPCLAFRCLAIPVCASACRQGAD